MAKLEITRGTTYSRTLTYKKNGVVTPLTGMTVFFTVKPAEYDANTTDSSASITKTLADLDDANAAEGIAVITIDPADSALLDPEGEYFYDIKVKETDGPPPVIYKVDEGTIVFDGSPTNRTS